MRLVSLHCQHYLSDIPTEHDYEMFCLALHCFLIDAFEDPLISGVIIHFVTCPLGTIVDSYSSWSLC